MAERYTWVQRRVLGFRERSTFGSNRRRLFTRGTAILVGVLAVEAVLHEFGAGFGRDVAVPGAFAVIWSAVFFSLVVLAIPFLTRHDWTPNVPRLALDTLVSVLATIFGYALLYRAFWSAAPETAGFMDAVYFSAVTFSTLGYGDFAPPRELRLLSALQAIIGNLHLGMIVGTAIFAMQPEPRSAEDQPRDEADDADDGRNLTEG